MQEVMLHEANCLAIEENSLSSRPVQESIRETSILVYVNGKLLKAAIDENGQIEAWLNVAPLNKSLLSRCRQEVEQ